jgi:hypothetical protein
VTDRWQVTQTADDIVHVVPVDDLRPHRFGSDCECQPRVECDVNSDFVVVHHAWDAREYFDLDPGHGPAA